MTEILERLLANEEELLQRIQANRDDKTRLVRHERPPRFVHTESEHFIILHVAIPTFGRADQDEQTARDAAKTIYHSVAADTQVFAALAGDDCTFVDVTYKPKPNLPGVE